MEDLSRRLCDLIRTAVEAGEPQESLAALNELREDLESFERAQVARALRSGASFGDVARMLGISRQAAHRRYRHLTATDSAGPEPGPARPGRILITSEARSVVRLARKEASGLGASAVGTEHLLLGILRLGDAVAAAALERAGVDLGAARSNATVTMVGMDRNGVPEGPVGISPHARAVFEQALHEAVGRGDGYVGSEHLLIAAVRDDTGGAYLTLEALGVDPRSVVADLSESLPPRTVALAAGA
jgi:transposase-like protein